MSIVDKTEEALSGIDFFKSPGNLLQIFYAFNDASSETCKETAAPIAARML